MHPFKTMTSQAELADLPENSVACPAGRPDLGVIKTGPDSWTAFGIPGTHSTGWAWSWVGGEDPAEAWLLWSPEVPAPYVPPVVWRTTIPSRIPRVKTHRTRGYARAAITGAMYAGRAHDDMLIEELDSRTGKFILLHSIADGDPISSLPWK
ncbi:hypothetical protein [Arthrobacter sp. zg-Y1110]|uniref:hypothetical protein n=1 Tax=Arthrobacter sp. zg-Y1110 TaxID=2886932 RepID=UPI001D138C82|nr:hypothetical protein [Arthrobacter sp. zg-Y1110]MCC3292532.1 hypothetical protein [Arthrobacter sp. zg-Y1110]UWX87036.1 hypothetical protein N2K99_16935 [Arthrobacter sp. zg-Y1110]